jgi:peroxiredoxin
MTRSNWLILGLAVLASAIGGYAQHREQPQAATESALIGQPVPALVLPGLDGTLHRLTDYRGHRVLLNFWASWCAPCLDEMPALNRAFVARHPPNYPVLLGQLTAPSTSLQLGDTREALPYSMLIDADGHVLATHAGALSPAQIGQWLGSGSTP